MRALALLLVAVLAAGGAAAVDAHAKAPKRCKHHRHKHGCAKKRKKAKKPHRPPTAATPSSPAPPAGPTTPATPPPPPATLGHLQIVAREYTFTASRLTLAPGRTAIELNNQGEDPHDLRVERVDDPSVRFDFDLTKASNRTTRKLDLTTGEWKLYCTVPGHDELGMHARVTVAG
jgi:plastocyanin